jgi:hypothetical protein
VTGAEEMQRRISEFTNPEHILDVIEELARRWERASNHALAPHDDNGTTFAAGRAAGYSQAIALLFGIEHKAAKEMLQGGAWRVEPPIVKRKEV